MRLIGRSRYVFHVALAEDVGETHSKLRQEHLFEVLGVNIAGAARDLQYIILIVAICLLTPSRGIVANLHGREFVLAKRYRGILLFILIQYLVREVEGLLGAFVALGAVLDADGAEVGSAHGHHSLPVAESSALVLALVRVNEVHVLVSASTSSPIMRHDNLWLLQSDDWQRLDVADQVHPLTCRTW